ncbi:hypothetical protein [Sphingosinicella rhizophila]|uniref:Uncharacterized protein n=1 Tax=Sphingosinicella rhizophila TaxID=3050082 RepID=A0ABU3Q5F9_9SPHN|nr:hypothetical protein [Sphingosinicella sp. GR2756]MDT9598642.1 hypothetical protein [Sphingosinicella sp. GR2756]
MGLQQDREYFEQRAESEIEMAQTARHEKAVRAHYEMAGLYLDRVHAPDDNDLDAGSLDKVEAEQEGEAKQI